MRHTLFIFAHIRLAVVAAILLSGASRLTAQKKGHPHIHYVLQVDAGDLSGYRIAIHLSRVPHHFRLAMATHHEYDDRFWRYVRDVQLEATGHTARLTRTDSAVWDVTIPGDSAVISYRLQLPGQHVYAHRPFLSSNGGLVGDIHSFMYLVGHTQGPAIVTFELPSGWQIATGLERMAGPKNTFHVSSAKMLMDCPVLAGRLHQWTFQWEGIPYTIAYLPVNDTIAFDTALLVANIRKIVIQTVKLFGGAPYTHYSFLLEDSVYGALEHANSVTIGAPSAVLSGPDIYEEIAHEFSHTWNLMNIQPAGYTDLNYGPQERSAGLWFSEGLAMFYADLLVRRAGLPCEDLTREAHLERLIGRYYADTGNTVLPPAMVSLAANAAPGSLGDYSASTHLQGELLGAMLDLLIRNATGGRHSFDDVMRLMYRRFGGKDSGFQARDVERAVQEVVRGGSGDNDGNSGGDDSAEVHRFFQSYIYEGKALDFNNYLRLIGLQLQLSRQVATDDKGQPMADTRLYIWQSPGDTIYRLGMTHPGSCWVKAGLHTGDVLEAIDGRPLRGRQEFYNLLKTLKPGDTMMVRIRRRAGVQSIPVYIRGYEIPAAHLIKEKAPGIREQNLLNQWEEGSYI